LKGEGSIDTTLYFAAHPGQVKDTGSDALIFSHVFHVVAGAADLIFRTREFLLSAANNLRIRASCSIGQSGNPKRENRSEIALGAQGRRWQRM